MEVVDGDIRYIIEDKLAHKLDLMIDRVTRDNQKQDAWIQNHGGTGEGKTNTSIVEAHYIKLKTKREVHLFFRLRALLDFAKNTEKKIIIWDEPSLDSLSTDQMRRINRDLLRLANTARKKRHFIIINFTKFWRFPEDIVVDTCLGMVHMYSKEGRDAGRFLYIRKNRLEALWNNYKKSGRRLYGKLKSFGGRMPNIMERYFDKMDFFVNGIPHATYAIYDKEKDRAIGSIGEDPDSKENKQAKKDYIKLMTLRYKIANVKGITKEELAVQLGIGSNRLREWAKIDLNNLNFLENEGFDEPPPAIYDNEMAISKEGNSKPLVVTNVL